MSPIMIEAPTATEAMKPMPEPVPLDSTVAEACGRMRGESAAFLAVISPEMQKLLGIVTQDALERGCASGGHEPATCRIVRHLEADVEFCFEEEQAEEALHAGDEWPPAHRRADAESLVVVVNARKVPVGYLER